VKIHYVDEVSPAEVVKAIKTFSADHVVSRLSPYLTYLEQESFRLKQNPQYFFTEEFIRGMSLDCTNIYFSGASDKSRMLSEVETFLKGKGNSSLLSASQAVIEELYMNAVLDAPRESKLRGPQTSHKQCHLFLSFTPSVLVISCTDFYGSLSISKFVDRMNEVYSRGAGEAMNRSGGGAGLGCVILFENSTSLFIGVKKGQMTRFVVWLPVKASHRQRERIPKSLHRIEIE
jgi:hypothetical protein